MGTEDALSTVAQEWDVPLMVTRGYPSLSYLHSAAQTIRHMAEECDKRTVLYYFGDYDPSGLGPTWASGAFLLLLASPG